LPPFAEPLLVEPPAAPAAPPGDVPPLAPPLLAPPLLAPPLLVPPLLARLPLVPAELSRPARPAPAPTPAVPDEPMLSFSPVFGEQASPLTIKTGVRI